VLLPLLDAEDADILYCDASWPSIGRPAKTSAGIVPNPGNRNNISSLASHSDLFESGNKVAWSTWVYFPDVSYVVSEDLHVVLITKSVQFEVYNLYRMSRTAYRTNNGSV